MQGPRTCASWEVAVAHRQPHSQGLAPFRIWHWSNSFDLRGYINTLLYLFPPIRGFPLTIIKQCLLSKSPTTTTPYTLPPTVHPLLVPMLPRSSASTGLFFSKVRTVDRASAD